MNTLNQNLRITLAQLNPTVGALDANTRAILETWKAQDRNSGLILFPELFLSGYPPEDLILNRSFIKEVDHKLAEIVEQSHSLTSAALIPCPWRDEDDLVYNAVHLVEKGRIIATTVKHHLPNYGVFDEKRVFAHGPLPEIITFRGVKLGIFICEDMWLPDTVLGFKEQGAQILISINGSPYETGKENIRLKLAKHAANICNAPLIYLNLVGGQDELVFDGASFALNPNTSLQATLPDFKEHTITIELEKTNEKWGITPNPVHIMPRHQNEASIYEALKLGLRDYVHKSGFKSVLIGLSGGIDSALVAALAADTLGPEHVHCVMLPSEFTSSESLEDAKSCAKMLGVSYEIIPIKEAITLLEKLIPDLSGLAHENTQSRLRGVILMALSNMSGAMLLTTGNKSEMATGYCTLYGDMNGGFNPLKDIYKTQVYKLARWRNSVKESIPERIITKPPSAELRPNQTDQDSLPHYDLLDAILMHLIERDHEAGADIEPEILARPEEVEKVARLLRITEYKRYQAPPGTKITSKAFGRDRRFPMVNGFTNKIEKPS